MNWILTALGIGGLGGLGLAIALIPGFGARLLGWFKVAIGIVVQYPWQFALAAALAWGWHGITSRDHRIAIEHEGWVNEIKARVAEHRAAEAAQAKVRSDAQDIAKENVHVHTIRAPAEMAAAVRFKRDNRIVRAPSRAAAPETGTAPDPATPLAPPTGPELVAVKPDDIDACTADHTYALDAFDLIKGWLAKGLAKPAEPVDDDGLPEPRPAFGGDPAQ